MAEAVPRKRRWRRRLGCCLAPCALLGIFLLHLATTAEPPRFPPGGDSGIAWTPWRQLAPGPTMPYSLGASNNNCDVIGFEGRTWLAFRTASVHFAAEDARLLVLSSADRVDWRLEHTVALGCDVREPRFAVIDGRLFFYYFRAGTDVFAFEPQAIQGCVLEADGRFSAPWDIHEPGYVVWRVRNRGDTAYMSVYDGAGLYTVADRPGDVRLLRSTDGRAWEAISAAPQITATGAEEGELCFDADGNLLATVRLEVQGSLVCRAPAEDLTRWETRFSPYKLDSAVMFPSGQDFYLIARRNVAGAFQRGSESWPASLRRGWSLARYSLTRKRTALYRIDADSLRAVPLLDFPSKGDTAFAGVLPLGDGRFWVVNYSSPLDGPDVPWLAGQLLESQLYESVLTLP